MDPGGLQRSRPTAVQSQVQFALPEFYPLHVLLLVLRIRDSTACLVAREAFSALEAGLAGPEFYEAAGRADS